jgi:transcriptional regulator with XRE-family HTH domain
MQHPVQNLIGPQLRRLRSGKEWSRNDLAVKLQLLGLDTATPGRVYKIEARYACVTDDELLFIARALNVNTDELYPEVIRCAKRLYDAVCTSRASRFGCLLGGILFLSKFGETAFGIFSTIASV